MTSFYSEDETVAAVSRLTRARLLSFVEARMVIPAHSDQGPVYRQMDLARLELLCDLSEQFDLEDDALGVVISLIDQLHGVRADLQLILEAIGNEPDEVRDRIGRAVQTARAAV